MSHLTLKKSWQVGVILVALLGAGQTASADIPSIFDDGKALEGVWVMSGSDSGVEQGQGLRFTSDGQFVLALLDSNGTAVQHEPGSYTYAKGVLTLTFQGGKVVELKVQYDNGDLLLRTEAGQVSRWIR